GSHPSEHVSEHGAGDVNVASPIHVDTVGDLIPRSRDMAGVDQSLKGRRRRIDYRYEPVKTVTRMCLGSDGVHHGQIQRQGIAAKIVLARSIKAKIVGDIAVGPAEVG